MLEAGFAQDAVSVKWLFANGTRFKSQSAKAGAQTQGTAGAALRLGALGFEVAASKAALDEIESPDG